MISWLRCAAAAGGGADVRLRVCGCQVWHPQRTARRGVEAAEQVQHAQTHSVARGPRQESPRPGLQLQLSCGAGAGGGGGGGERVSGDSPVGAAVRVRLRQPHPQEEQTTERHIPRPRFVIVSSPSFF